MSEAFHSTQEKLPSEQFSARLQDILYSQVTVENIDTFADDALEDLIALNESVVERYQKDFEGAVPYTGTELEDNAYKAYELEDLNTILDRITEVKEKIEGLKIQLTEALAKTDTVITPPDKHGPVFSKTGNGTYEAPNKVNRLLTLTYILSRDFEIDQSRMEYTKGSITDNMLRKEPYIRVLIEDINRIVYVCDEEDNASYVFDTEVLEHLGITPSELDEMTKNQRNALIRVTPSVGRRIIQSPEWRSVVSAALREDLSDEKTSEQRTTELQSEFRERVKFQPYTEFEIAVREAYVEAGSLGDVEKWYRSTYKEHPGWPANPNVSYKKEGWKSWPELIGREVFEFLPYIEFKSALQEAYIAAGLPGNVQKWYQSEYKNQVGWPSKPHRTYKKNGFESLPQLLGREVTEYLTYDEFIDVVREAYNFAKKPSNIREWYASEQSKHADWPAQPRHAYLNEGWESWRHLVGKELVEFLPFESFVEEVQKVYSRAGRPKNVHSWYIEEQKKHPTWPSAPNVRYADRGWNSYPELVGKNGNS